MNKITNWVFGSFFRTLGRVLVYLVIGFLVAYALKDTKMPKFNLSNLLFMNVFADEREVKLDGTILTSSNYKVINSGNRTLSFVSDTIYSDSVDMPSYFLLTLCADNQKITNWYVNSNSLTEINIYNTNYKCSFPNSTYTGGHIVYVYGTYNKSTSCNVSLMNCLPVGNITFYNPSASSWSLLSYQDSNESINIDFSGDTIISQNQEIINQNTQIIQGQQSIINNQNSNTQDIIDNQNQNKQDIIDNQNANTDREIESQQVCKNVSIGYSDTIEYGTLSYNGNINSSSNWRITDYVDISGTQEITLSNIFTSGGVYFCFYDNTKTLISCLRTITENINPTIPNNSYYARFSIRESNQPIINFRSCKNGNQATADKLEDMNSSINDSDSSGATSDASNFFSNFTTDTHGLTGIITAPLNAINSLTNQSCSPLVLPLPFINQDLTLPCMREIYDEYFGSFMTLYDVITLGIVSYWVMVRIFGLVKDFKNPEHDEIEVVDL